ncbi:MAG: hypothetical protein ACK40I_13060 [Tabrizicola sp.]
MLWLALAAVVGTVLIGAITMRQPAEPGRQRHGRKSGDGGDGTATLAATDDGAACDAGDSCGDGGGGGGGD